MILNQSQAEAVYGTPDVVLSDHMVLFDVKNPCTTTPADTSNRQLSLYARGALEHLGLQQP